MAPCQTRSISNSPLPFGRGVRGEGLRRQSLPFNSLPKVGEKQSFHFNDHHCRIVVKLIAAKFAHRVDNDRLQLIGAAPLLLDE